MNLSKKHKLNYSNAIYIPPSQHGTYVVAENNKIKIFTKSSSNQIFNKFLINNKMKPLRMKDYLNYNSDDFLLTYINKVSTFKQNRLRGEENNLVHTNLKPKINNYEPFNRYDSNKINTFNRFIYLPAPKTTPEDIIIRHKSPVPNRNLNKYSKRSSIDSDSSSSTSVSNENIEDDNLSSVSGSLYDSDVNTLNVNEEINLDNEISSTSSEYEFLNDNIVRSYKPYKPYKASKQPATNFSTEFIFKKKNINPNAVSIYDTNQETSSILRHISELAKQRADAFSKRKNLYRVF